MKFTSRQTTDSVASLLSGRLVAISLEQAELCMKLGRLMKMIRSINTQVDLDAANTLRGRTWQNWRN